MFTIQKAIHTIKGDNSKCLFKNYAPFFDLDFLSPIKHPTAECWHPHALFLFLFLFYSKS